jgi:hypothetical protein
MSGYQIGTEYSIVQSNRTRCIPFQFGDDPHSEPLSGSWTNSSGCTSARMLPSSTALSANDCEARPPGTQRAGVCSANGWKMDRRTTKRGLRLPHRDGVPMIQNE